ncbi:hydroxyethylthiazole kinase-like uncharacterized protein yjeF [Sphingobium sp. B2D3A]|uniref:NAD(P)H-hydrate dehydratase n=1 Tax=unclassified Sphingobium TaxID=2611147 RepID=UPI0022246BDF|nr:MULTISPECIES: NAD(P)H-hydrate dehydratase [unclassified Sphingobium]MCW2336997.1 hydroxyethylthiazole kinase-like uncharacterized protein yjeF [Sphingobium sp. B2D3A]MCW2386750.1 hydroxyethylthiazole kinase-like uncharacterized protein yjeF [Sphingobium sp. B2D3D]
MMPTLDRAWLEAHPLPPIAALGDKDARGRVLLVGGAEFVPGALRLTGEAALRAGAGKLQMATVRSAAMALAVLVPEAAMIALPADEDGEIALEAVALLQDRLARCDTLILGPGMSAGDRTEQFVAALLGTPSPGQTIILDAAALTCARKLEKLVAAHEGRVILTPHHREMSFLTGQDIDVIRKDPRAAALHVARAFNAVVVLKSAQTLIASPREDEPLLFEGGSIGLATGGSGDVLAGLIGGLAARGADPLRAAAWGVFVHGAAGARVASEIAEVGFLARDLLPVVPGLIASLEPER